MASKTSVIVSMVAAAIAATGCSSKQEPMGSGGGGAGGGGTTTSSTTSASSTSSSSSSSSSGSMPGCGDGIIAGDEQCDDGNAASGDGCSSSCQVEAGFSCTGKPSACTCTPGAFLGCDGATSVSCNASGDGTVVYGCGAGGCIPSPGASGCGQCAATSCTAGTPGSFVSCDEAHGVILASGTCAPTLGAATGKSECNGTACAECVGTSVCGDGAAQGSKLDHAYTCSPEGKLGPGMKCAFGCDPQNGQCKDLVPASQAGGHLATGDAFTCSGPQDATLPAITVPPMSDVVIDTSAKTFAINTVPVSGVRWGTPYKPVGSGTTAIVAHVKSLAIGTVVKVTVTGANALILLVDQDVTASGLSAAAPTVITAAADRYLQAGPGAPSTTGGTGTFGGYPNFYGVGGAGHLGQGGKGGTGNGVAGTAGGGIYGIAPMTALLEAGATGGTCGGPSGQNVGGRGGGALQITACGKIDLGANVIVNASGGGGQANHSFVGQGGGGGGSGGTLILEASVLAIAGALVSNGGGGGSGDVCATADGGNWGGSAIGSTAVSTPASGGSCNPMSIGGNGGAGTSVDGQAGSNAGTFAFGGGGGGACGPIFVNVPPGTAPMIAAASPAPKVSATCLTTNGAPPAACAYAP